MRHMTHSFLSLHSVFMYVFLHFTFYSIIVFFYLNFNVYRSSEVTLLLFIVEVGVRLNGQLLIIDFY
jgi:hypothetical protein